MNCFELKLISFYNGFKLKKTQVLSNDHQIRNCIGQLFLNTIITAPVIFVHSSEGSDLIYCSAWQG